MDTESEQGRDKGFVDEDHNCGFIRQRMYDTDNVYYHSSPVIPRLTLTHFHILPPLPLETPSPHTGSGFELSRSGAAPQVPECGDQPHS